MEHITVKEIVEATDGRLLCGNPSTPLIHISIDSRVMKGQDLFVPLVGEKVDAHRFISQAIQQGAAAVLTSEHDEMDAEIPWIRVEDTKKALQCIGTYYRNRLKLPLIGITGSVGKTTTREMIAAGLSAAYQVYKTPANHNSQVGVPITLSEIGQKDEVGVIELGMSEPGELTVIAQIANVEMAVITNIGVTHMEQLGSKENIFKEKLSIQDGLKQGGILFLNGDDELLKNTKAREGFRTIYYGTKENSDYRAEDIVMNHGFPSFTAVYQEERVPVQLQVMGLHNVQNAMVALAVARELKVPMEDAAARLGAFTGFQNRQQIFQVNGITMIDDTYNASPVSMKAGIDVLRSLAAKGRKIAVLADMKELGEKSPQFHYEIGAYLKEHPVDLVVTLGELVKEIGQSVPIVVFNDRVLLIQYLEKELSAGDCVLLKGSNSMKLEEVVTYFKRK